MPSPFPGMDPFLEDPAGWPNLHVNLITEIQAVLNRQLRPNYYARAEDRVYISDQDDPGRRVIAPDVRVLAREQQPPGPWVSLGDTAAVAVAEPVEVVTLIEDEIRELRVEVIDASQRQVVTVIEVLSPTNKISGARGQQSYRRKRAEVLASHSHWVEVDLLRDGERLVAAALMPYGDYSVHVSRVERRPSGKVWPILPRRPADARRSHPHHLRLQSRHRPQHPHGDFPRRRRRRREALAMIKRRVRDAGLPDRICCHTFRATGITAYLLNGGTLEHAQRIAAHESPRTTKLYDRTSDEITLDEIERILI